ncbi:MAG: metallophosphoesterase [Candidatus Hodarchaeota archaeon]
MKAIILGDIHGRGLENLHTVVEMESPDIIASTGDYSNIMDFELSEESALIQLFKKEVIESLGTQNVEQARKIMIEGKSSTANVLPYLEMTTKNPETYRIIRNQINDTFRVFNDQEVPVLLIPGNHDAPEIFSEEAAKFSNLFNIHKNYYFKSEIVFVGYGGAQLSPFEFRSEFDEENALAELLEILEQVSSYDKKIMITHAPPFELRDLTKRGHVGSRAIREAYERAEPLALVCGHIHESAGREKNVLNVGEFRKGFYGIIETNKKLKKLELRNYLKSI